MSQLKTYFSLQLHLFFTALTFFTRLPAPKWVNYSEDYLNPSVRYFSLVGVLVGGIGAIVFWLANLLWPTAVAILLSMIATILTTGAFHEDGFADSCDGFGGGWGKMQVLNIMKDSRIGAYGAVGIGFMLALKFFALNAIDPQILPWLLIAGHSLSRFASTTLIYTCQYVREDALSKAKPLARKMSAGELLAAALFALMPLLLLTWRYWLLLIPVAIAIWLLGRYFVRRIGGYTGDCLGAAQQVTEVIFYLFASINWQ
ncbi:MAG TPA: adenosylcobinamide-GDP ribazoletransferase [Chloroflexi bacterium]|nr:MAG: adenosylcobinamide-GDP ribazoletransferase [Anaerolineaceae bacterium 4572_5.2]HEY85243.1 adenosylcobinamide-GDP ribazoletransferase [Chloroflexota bacterium]